MVDRGTGSSISPGSHSTFSVHFQGLTILRNASVLLLADNALWCLKQPKNRQFLLPVGVGLVAERCVLGVLSRHSLHCPSVLGHLSWRLRTREATKARRSSLDGGKRVLEMIW
jgi:hypothetical protein